MKNANASMHTAEGNAVTLFAAATALALFAGAFWFWVITDWVTPFLVPFVGGLGVLLFAVSGIASVNRAVRQWPMRRRVALAPLAMNVATIIVLAVVPFTKIWLRANFRWNRVDREQVVEEVCSGVLKPNVSYNPSLITLPEKWPTLSLGGNQIVTPRGGESCYVLFFTYRGILGSYSGFLHVPPRGSPETFAALQGDRFFQVVAIDPQWFFVAGA